MFPGSQIVASLKTRLWYKISAQCRQRHITLKVITLFQCWGFLGNQLLFPNMELLILNVGQVFMEALSQHCIAM